MSERSLKSIENGWLLVDVSEKSQIMKLEVYKCTYSCTHISICNFHNLSGQIMLAYAVFMTILYVVYHDNFVPYSTESQK